MSEPDADSLTRQVGQAITGRDELIDGLIVTGPRQILPSVFDVTGLATATIGAATAATAQLLATRSGQPLRACTVDRRAAAAAFVSEALFTPDGWQRPAVWDVIAGDYLARDGWIKLHTNYSYHRTAAESVLGVAGDRDAVTTAVAHWAAADLETAIVASGGCAAAMHGRSDWLAMPAGRGTAEEPLVRVEDRPAAQPTDLGDIAADAAPLAGVRVLDLTRVIAGPVCTRFLAAYGADVLRIDPPDFAEVAALVPETSVGKRCATLDLSSSAGREVFDALVAQANVLVTGLRPGALDHLGYDDTALTRLNPGLVTASLDAYGWTGPWSARRGFDSLVQMSTGIAAAGAAARGGDRPVPLPAQALDHGTGYLLAAAIVHALTRLICDARVSDIRCSLVATANLLVDQPTPEGLDTPSPAWSSADNMPTRTAWGPARRVPIPGRIDGVAARLGIDAGPLGRHSARWATR